MAVIDETIRLEENNTLSFGNYSVKEKKKVSDFKVAGDIYKIKTHDEVTRLEKNSKLVIETVPGAALHNFKMTEKETSFDIEGTGDTQITLELETDTNYKIYVDDVNLGRMKSNLSGKVSFSIELNSNTQKVKIDKN